MREYEVVLTYLNGCAGEAHPITTFEELELESPESYLMEKHGKDYPSFVKEVVSPSCTRFRFDNGTVVYTYEFNEF